MKLVQHPNVVRLYEVIDTQTKLYLILELGDGGDLYDYIMKHDTGLSEQLAREYFRQIVKAIKYCHQLHVVHRDLKPENVVFFEKLGMVKLTDFGFSNKFCPGQKLETSCGSLAYSAPEILLGDSYDAPAVGEWKKRGALKEIFYHKFNSCLRHLVAGSDPVHVGVRSAAVSRGQRLGDVDHDHGLQVHDARVHFRGLPKAHFNDVGARTRETGDAAADRG